MARCRLQRFSDGLAEVRKDVRSGFIDKTGKLVIPFKFDDAWSFSDGLAAVRKGNLRDGKWGILTLSADPAPKPPVSTGIAYASTQNIELDGRAVEVQAYALRDANGNPTNYVETDKAYIG